MKERKPEVLAPAGDLTRLMTAVDFGADAVYLAGEEFGMRTAATNFGKEDLLAGITYAHDHCVKVYITCNTIPHNEEMARLPAFLTYCEECGADGLIVSDLGTLTLAKQAAPHTELHISVQSGIVNYETAKAYYALGAKRIVAARELSLTEIKEIRDKVPDDLQIEAFCHGAMCVSFSARCLLSSYMTGRDANRGDCAQACRWSYSLMEEKRPGQYFDITETDKGTYILNANDLCMADHIAEMAQAGVDSFKIEGRAKSQYYVAVTTNAYRGAVDTYLRGESTPKWVMEELDKISHRTYSTGFYYGRPENAQTYENAGYQRDYAVAGLVEGYENGFVLVRVKNKFAVGTELDCLSPRKAPFTLTVNTLQDEAGRPIPDAPHPMSLVKLAYPEPIAAGSLLRMKA